MIPWAQGLSAPTRMRSGCRESSTARPSRRNSGLDATWKAWGEVRASTARIRSAVCTGTVDFSTTTMSCVAALPRAVATPSTASMFGSPVGRPGVPTQMNATWASATASAMSPVKRRRPDAVA